MHIWLYNHQSKCCMLMTLESSKFLKISSFLLLFFPSFSKNFQKPESPKLKFKMKLRQNSILWLSLFQVTIFTRYLSHRRLQRTINSYFITLTLLQLEKKKILRKIWKKFFLKKLPCHWKNESTNIFENFKTDIER